MNEEQGELNESLEEDSLANDLAAAWAEHEGAETDEPVQSTSTTETAAASDTPSDTPAADADAVSGEQGQADTDDGSDKPPVSLPAAAREAWKDTPKAVKEALAKRERDYSVGIQKYAESANRALQMDQALAPHQQYLAMNGGPAQAIQGLLQTASLLQMGTPVQRAQAAANVIKQFGVDIQTLDSLLAGEAPNPQVQAESHLDQILAQKLAPYQQYIQQVEQEKQFRAQQGQQVIANEVTQFSQKQEFYNDVRADMADILDMAANRGMNMTLQQAYERACMLHPEVSKILQARQSAPTAGQRRAASSISGSPGGSNDNSLQADDVRSAIERAWDMAGRT